MSLTLDGQREVPFNPLNLTLDQQQHCQDLSYQLLDRTLRSYDERDASRDAITGSPRHHANLDSTRWKQLRTQTNASLYSERTRATCTPRDLHLPGDNWDNPCVLLAVGSIESNLSEVMFGLETPDFLAMQVRSETLGKQPLDGAVLAQLAGPTETDPFQFMGITWMVGEQSWPLNMVVRPRDFIIVTATGVVSRPNGERIGYEVVQSIDLPQCPELPKPMLRGKLMYGAIYRQIEKGAVDVYIQMYVEPQGRLMDKLVIAAMWESTLGFWNAPQLSETKKLQWCIESKSVKRREQASALAHSDTVESSACENCLKKRSMLSRRRSTHLNDDNICALCATPLCSSCRVRKTLKLPGEDRAKLLDVEVAVCQACILFAQKQCPATIATHNQKQRQAVSERSRSASWRLTQESMWDQPTFSPLGSAIRYPSISMSDLVKLINPESMQPAGYPWDRTSG
ncbi:hypothetical protein PI124_g11538 [Phytophthora idaei]|nr:hypothetical protein PI125_g17015 [Phytophthora idaei]KAG3243643.1 hypothetical protein PI124_g11538 [Phytophthora idaei]